MMQFKAPLLGLVMAAAMLVAGPALAQTDWAEDFKRLCGDNPSNYDKAIAAAPGRGYAAQGVDETGRFQRFTKGKSPETQLLIDVDFTDRLARQVGFPGAVSRTCGLTGFGLDPEGIDVLQDWVGLSPTDDDKDFPKYLFRIVDGRKVSMIGESDAVYDEQLKSGGYWFVGMNVNKDQITATMTHIKAAP